MPFGPLVPDYCCHSPDPHRCDRRIVLIGEAPAAREVEHLIPFVGRAGLMLGQFLDSVGWDRSLCYITNVYPYRAINDDIATVPRAELEQWTQKLHERIARLEDPWLIVPMGNTALKALTGQKSIMNYRGSIMSYRDLNGRTIKVVPTIHPAAVLRQPYWEKRVRRDWKRIREESETREVRLPEREHIIHPTYQDIAQFAEEVRKRRKEGVLGVDIETDPPTNRMLCIAFSYDPQLGITLPLEGGAPDYKAMMWRAAKAYCESPIAKVLQNGSFDRYHLYFNAINLRNYVWDTLDLHSLIDANEDHSLAFLASVYTREPFYKNERKEGGTGTFDYEVFLAYNSKDACVTREVLAALIDEAQREVVIAV